MPFQISPSKNSGTKRVMAYLLIALVAMTGLSCDDDPKDDSLLFWGALYYLANRPASSAATCQAFSLTANSASYFNSIKPDQYVPGEMLVRTKSGVGVRGLRSLANRSGITHPRALRAGSPGGSELFLVRLPRGKSIGQAYQELSGEPDIISIQPNFIYRSSVVPSDPSFVNQWGFQNSGQMVNGISGTAGKDINITTAWNTISDCSSVKVAVVDTGINYLQEDLAANMWNGSACVDPAGAPIAGGCITGYDYSDVDNDPMDLSGHGTHVAGIIGAAGNNAKGVSGVCQKVQIMNVRVLNASGSTTTAKVVQGIGFAVANGASVINLSLGGGFGFTGDALDTAIENARTNGVIVVAAAGNSATDNDASPVFPANYNRNNIISVAAVDQNGLLSSFSNYGASCVDVGAPGSNILSTYPMITTITDPLTTGWLEGGNLEWGYSPNEYYGPNPFNMLTNHDNWYFTNYANSQDSHIYKTFDLLTGGYTSAQLSFMADLDLADAGDTFSVNYGIGAVPPATPLYSVSNYSTGTALRPIESLTPTGSALDLSGCLSITCTIGFRLQTNASGNARGAGIAEFAIIAMDANNIANYDYLNGTSMAAPHVTGLVALLKAYRPLVTDYRSIINAVYAGGTDYSSLSGKTVTGRMINAQGSLSQLP